MHPNSISFSMVHPQTQSCDVCQRVMRKFDKPLHTVPVKLGAWQQIGIDVVSPLPETPSGNKYIMMVIDYFSKWPEAKAIPTKEACHVAEFLYMHCSCAMAFVLVSSVTKGVSLQPDHALIAFLS